MPLTLLGRHNPLASAREQLRILGGSETCPPFEARLANAGLHPLHATGIRVFQINVGKLCNQTCRHCHVEDGMASAKTDDELRAAATDYHVVEEE